MGNEFAVLAKDNDIIKLELVGLDRLKVKKVVRLDQGEHANAASRQGDGFSF